MERGRTLSEQCVNEKSGKPAVLVTTRRNALARAVALTLPLILSGEAHALGLGNVDVRSMLGQRLDVVIPIHVSEAENQALSVQVPNYWDHHSLGLLEPVMVDDLRVRIIDSEDGGKWVRLSSSGPVKEPAMNFLLRLRTADQELVREISLLLDPLQYLVTSAPTPEPTTIQSSGTNSWTATLDAQRRYGPVRQGETLYAIVAKHYPGLSAGHEQVMSALVDLNRREFVGGNANQLMAGSWLTLPTIADMTERLASGAAVTPTSSTATGAASTNQTQTYGPVEAGETLYSIARRFASASGTSIPNLMETLVASNPQAFINGDANLLREGEVLTLSATTTVSSETSVATPLEQVKPVADSPAITTVSEEASTTVETVVNTDTQAVSSESVSDTTNRQIAELIADSKLTLEQDQIRGEQLSSEYAELTEHIEALEAMLAKQDEHVAELSSRIDNLANRKTQTISTAAGTTTAAHSITQTSQLSGASNDTETTAFTTTDSKPARIERPTPTNVLDMLPVSATTLGLVLAGGLLFLATAWMLRRRSRVASLRDHRV